MLGVRVTFGHFWPQHPVWPAFSFPRPQGIVSLLTNRAAAQKFSTPLFPGRENGISWRALLVGGEVLLITLNSPAPSAGCCFSSFSFCPIVSWNRLNTDRGAAVSARCSRETWFLLWIQSWGVSDSQESDLWRCHNPSCFNLEFAKGSLGHHLTFILDLVDDYAVAPKETTSCTLLWIDLSWSI